MLLSEECVSVTVHSDLRTFFSYLNHCFHNYFPPPNHYTTAAPYNEHIGPKKNVKRTEACHIAFTLCRMDMTFLTRMKFLTALGNPAPHRHMTYEILDRYMLICKALANRTQGKLTRGPSRMWPKFRTIPLSAAEVQREFYTLRRVTR